MQTLLGVFLFAHAFIHGGVISGPGGNWLFDPARAPLVRLTGMSAATLRPIGIILWLIGMVAFVAVGLAYFGWLLPHEWLRPLAIGASLFSLLLMGLFWHPWLVAAVAINITILVIAWRIRTAA